MLMVADIGNSQCRFATFVNDKIDLRKNIPLSEWHSGFLNAFDECDIDSMTIIAVADKPIADIQNYCKARNITCQIVCENEDFQLPARNKDALQNLGADRAMNILGAKHFTSPPFIVIDCGTATTLDYCDQHGQFVGGIILPGTKMMAKSLHDGTDKLPLIEEIKTPSNILGTNTIDAINSAMTYGYSAMLEGLIKQIFTAEKQQGKVIVCGGAADLIAKSKKFNFILKNDLTLWGGWCYSSNANA